VLGHGEYEHRDDFREKFRTTHDRNSPHEARSPRCQSNYVLRGFNIEQRPVLRWSHGPGRYQYNEWYEYPNEQWLVDIKDGLCISADM
jgi:hypothetical protein